MPEAQAKALSQALQEAQSTSHFVTKHDLRESVAEHRLEMQSFREAIRGIEPRLTIRLGGIDVLALGAFTALSKWIASEAGDPRRPKLPPSPSRSAPAPAARSARTAPGTRPAVRAR